MFCSKCGIELPEGAKFCHNCGTKAMELETSASAVSLGAVGPAQLDTTYVDRAPQPALSSPIASERVSPPTPRFGLRLIEDRAQWLIGIAALSGAALIVVGSFLPWDEREASSRSGLEAGYLTDLSNGAGFDGAFMLALGGVVALVALHYFFVRHAWASVLCVLLALAALGLGMYDLARLLQDVRHLGAGTREAFDAVGGGLHLCMLGGVIAVIVGLIGAWRAAED